LYAVVAMILGTRCESHASAAAVPLTAPAGHAPVNLWIDGGRAKLVSHGVDTERLDREIAEFAPEARERAFEQFDRIAAHWWGNGDAGQINEP
jgi:hypothetical protein